MLGTTTDKLSYLRVIKNDIKNAIIEKGVNVDDTLNFNFYSDKIKEIYYETPYSHTTILIDQTIQDPSTMISIIYDDGGLELIRKNSHRYLCKKEDNILKIKQLNDNNSNLFLDNTIANISGEDGDVMMKLPSFYYKAWSEEPNKWFIDFVYGETPLDDYKKWEGNEFIGVYEGTVINGMLRSISNSYPTTNMTYLDSKIYSRNNGEGYSAIPWKVHSILCFLFLSYYKNTNSQNICGYGLTENETILNGTTDLLGMNDTIYNENEEEITSVNFWGLEKWWGGHYEWLDNVFHNDNGSWRIEEDNVYRTMEISIEPGFIQTLSIGEYLDAAPILTSGTSTTGFCDRSYNTSENRDLKIVRSGKSTNITSGVFYIAARRDDEEINNLECIARLFYKGNYIII